MLRELLGRARAEGDLTVLTGPDPFYAEVAYYALREAIRKLAQLGPDAIDDRRFDGALPEAQSGLDEVFSGAPARSDSRSPAERRHALAEALRWALLSAARRAGKQRVILAIDDIYRVDGPSRNAFADIVGEPPACSTLVISTHIPGFEAGWGADAAARVLAGLPPPQCRACCAPAATARALCPKTRRASCRCTSSKCFAIRKDGGSDPPSRLADLIALRVDTLEPNARRTLQALSVIGDEMKPDTLLELLPKTENLDGMLNDLQRAGMVELDAGRVSTSHPLLREIVLSGIPATARKDLHAKALRACERISAPIEARAQHAYYAGDSFQALLLLEQVADRATARGDAATEVLALRRGLKSRAKRSHEASWTTLCALS